MLECAEACTVPTPRITHITHTKYTPFKRKNGYPVLALGEKTAVQAVVGPIVWAFRGLEKPRSREMSARGYALHKFAHSFPFPVSHCTAYRPS